MRVACLRGFAVVAASVALMASPAIGETIESATTPFDVDKCTHNAGHEAEAEGEWHCVGYAGIPVRMTAGDVRVYISYGAKAAHEPAATQTLAAPNGEANSPCGPRWAQGDADWSVSCSRKVCCWPRSAAP